MRLGLLGAAALLALPAQAQTPRVVKDMAGTYQLLPVDGRPGCTILLTEKRAHGDSWVAKPSMRCASRITAAAAVTAWRPEDGVLLLNAQEKVEITFVEDETTLLASPDLITPAYYLIPAMPGFTHVPQPSELAGEWTIGQGQARCTIRLRPDQRAGSETRALAASPACAGTTARLNYWWLEGLTLLLGGPNDLLVRFQPNGDAQFRGESYGRNSRLIGNWTLTRPIRAKGSAQ